MVSLKKGDHHVTNLEFKQAVRKYGCSYVQKENGDYVHCESGKLIGPHLKQEDLEKKLKGSLLAEESP